MKSRRMSSDFNSKKADRRGSDNMVGVVDIEGRIGSYGGVDATGSLGPNDLVKTAVRQ